MNSRQFQNWLKKQGCKFYPGKGGHKEARLGTRKSIVPTHGGKKQLGKGLMESIKKDLGLK